MILTKIRIKNFRSIKDSGEILFNDNIFTLVGQNESGKSSILQALKSFEDENFDKDDLNFEEEQRENLEQTVSCTYATSDNFYSNLEEKLRKEFSIEEDADFIDEENLKKIKSYTIIKKFNHSDETLAVELNETIFGILKASIKNKQQIQKDKPEEETISKYINVDEHKEKIAEIFFSISPEIILFDDFQDLLPDKIKISDLENKETKGYKAVKNLESLLNKKFTDIAQKSTGQKKSAIETENKEVSVDFQKYWKQKIYGNNDVKIIFDIQYENIGGQAVDTIFFYVQTKDGVLLEPRKRSKGMIWFLSAWLDLYARKNDNSLIILYDEPGQHLHIKAHKDILSVFSELIKNDHQIIYSTHSPSLVDTNNFYNIGLVLNTEDGGTVIEKISTSRLDTEYRKDALQPVSEAMGFEPLKEFTVLSQKNVLLEGLSDFYYFQGMKKILNKQVDYKFIPALGIKDEKIYHLISFCIGYGLDWLLLMDNGIIPKNTQKDLKEKLFNDNEDAVKHKIKLLDTDEIENIFNISDLCLVDKGIKKKDIRKPVTIIGKNNKIIFAKNFLNKVISEEIKKEDLNKKTIESFEKAFSWIEGKFSDLE